MRRAIGFLVLLALVASVYCQSNPAFVFNGSWPWGRSVDYQAELDSAYGAGNWDLITTATAASVVFNPSRSIVRLEAAANSANAGTYYQTNMVAIHDWIANGGTLLFNPCDWSGSIGFGMSVGRLLSAPFNAAAGQASHDVFTTPHAVATAFTGNYATHNSISGVPPSATVIGEGLGGPTFVEYPLGNGRLLVSTFTSSFYWNPDPDSTLFQENIYAYLDQGCSPSLVCPASFTAAAGVVHYTVSQTNSGDCPASHTGTTGPASGASVPVGTHPVVVTYTSDEGKAESCTFTITAEEKMFEKPIDDENMYLYIPNEITLAAGWASRVDPSDTGFHMEFYSSSTGALQYTSQSYGMAGQWFSEGYHSTSPDVMQSWLVAEPSGDRFAGPFVRICASEFNNFPEGCAISS